MGIHSPRVFDCWCPGNRFYHSDSVSTIRYVFKVYSEIAPHAREIADCTDLRSFHEPRSFLFSDSLAEKVISGTDESFLKTQIHSPRVFDCWCPGNRFYHSDS